MNYQKILPEHQSLRFLLAMLLVVSALTMRPMLFGEIYTAVSLAILVFCMIIALPLRIVVTAHEDFKRNIMLAFLIVLLWGYLLLHAVLLGISDHFIGNIIKSSITFLIVAFCFAVFLSDRTLSAIFFRLMIWLFLIQIFSYFVSIVLIYGFGIDGENLKIFHLETAYQEIGGWLMLPATFTYGTMEWGGITLYRLGGPFREAGIFQAFIIWAYFTLPVYRMNWLWARMALFAGLIFTMSTAGIAVFFACYALKVLWTYGKSPARRVGEALFAAGAAAVGIAAVLFFPVFGLLEKLETREGSISDRLNASVLGINELFRNPIGSGFYNNSFEWNGVNFIASSSLIGIIGVLLVVVMVLYAVLSLENGNTRKMFVIGMMPLAITAMVSQPFIDAPFVYILLMQSAGVLKGDGIPPKLDA